MSQKAQASIPNPSPTVFISYAHESEDLRASVKALAGWLSDHNCTVLTDHTYIYRPPEVGWQAWMLNCIGAADTVLVVCTPKLKDRYEKNAAPDAGRGAAYEGAIVTQHIYDNAMRNTKFFPILPDGGHEDDIPVTLRPWWNNHWFPSGAERIRHMIFTGSPNLERSPSPPLLNPSFETRRTPQLSSSDLLSYPATYIQELFELLSGPKRFIAQRRADGTLTIERALAFFILSTLIIWSVPPYTGIVGDILFVPVIVMSFGFAIVFAWRLVGGTAKLSDYIPILFYYSPVFSFILVISNRVSWGLLRTIDPKFYGNFIEELKSGNLIIGTELIETASSYTMLVMGLGVLFYILVAFCWFIAGWGAYRALNGVSRRRSALAAVLFLCLALPIFGILSLIASALLAEAGLT